ncbi:MarR family winged helix-turn-helix transcriptional regulator [Desulfovibrio inopinatus]|uniref:MarR family winged helix-turn-helix transcriptional regulator n=1 Tax=Desulfovibrio inopinatus TaxID=102109 RepID=UPI0003F9893C|nr:MarR family transcriptional regulator [Desulfovibrio inopinatus]
MSSDNIHDFALKSPGRRLSILGRLSMAYMAGPLKQLGITRGEIGFIISVLQNEGIFQEELSELLFIDRAATTRALYDLERKGLMKREPDADDRRKKRIYSTEKCQTLKPELLGVLDKFNEALFRGLTPNEQKHVLGIMDKLICNLRSAMKEEA